MIFMAIIIYIIVNGEIIFDKCERYDIFMSDPAVYRTAEQDLVPSRNYRPTHGVRLVFRNRTKDQCGQPSNIFYYSSLFDYNIP